MKKAIIYFSITLFFSHFVFSQEQNKNLLVSEKTHYGFIIPHRSNIEILIKGHIKMYEVVVSKPTFGAKQWQQIYGYPNVGLSLMSIDLANPEQLGNGFAIIPHINFSIMKKKYFKLNFRVGTGLGYFTKKFNPKDNYKNNIIGSSINGSVSFLLENKIRFSDRLSMENGIGFTHFSNGSFTVPNLGFNLPTVNTGFSYLFGSVNKQVKKDSIPPAPKKSYFSIILNGGLKELFPSGGPKYPAWTLMGTVDKPISYKSKLGVGLDLFYEPGLKNKFDLDTNIKTIRKMDYLQSGVNISYAYTVDRLSLLLNMGSYLSTKYKGDGNFYHRIGLRYHFQNRIIANLSIKTHWAKADHIELGIGYRLGD